MSSAIRLPDTAFRDIKLKRNKGKSPTYLSWIRTLPCCVTFVPWDVVAHHVRLERAADGGLKSDNRLGKRVPDWQCVPLNNKLHDGYGYSLHSGNEAEWWAAYGLDPLILTEQLTEEYHGEPNHGRAVEIITKWRKENPQ